MARRLLLVAALALVFPATSAAGLASLQVRELPLGNARALSASQPTGTFQLVGIHWRGPGRLELRTRDSRGGWSPWRPVREDDGDAPDPTSGEQARTRGWRLGARRSGSALRPRSRCGLTVASRAHGR